MEWHSPTFPPPRKSHLQKFKFETMLIAFFDNDGINTKDFVPASQAVNATFCEHVLKRLLQRNRSVRPEVHMPGKWILQQDNALSHCAVLVRQLWLSAAYCYRQLSGRFPAWGSVNRKLSHPDSSTAPVLSRLTYSRDLAPADFFLFPRLTSVLEGARFAPVEAIQRRVTAILATDS
ncbi:hypothetical protein PR048_019953 [Dryococelus australis]|uniref:Mariner Mos1 transposase n=1 Tax=Dryococelus australis TaxID=614101 RepID=A0ABQ9H4X2_9NEOP|nr:hypothetical protein PR048_019953 [Dryococelus australis]